MHWLQIRIGITVGFGREWLIAGRTAAPAATKRTPGFAHAVVVWLRRKVLLEWLTGTADITHGKSGTFILFGMARYQSCARARMVLSTAGIVQQQVEWYGAVRVQSTGNASDSRPSLYLCSYQTEAGSCQLCSIAGGFQDGFETTT